MLISIIINNYKKTVFGNTDSVITSRQVILKLNIKYGLSEKSEDEQKKLKKKRMILKQKKLKELLTQLIIKIKSDAGSVKDINKNKLSQ
ncbi:MAG: hypothetical protein R2942_01560 [Ignavibacteria bacterium]